MTDAPLLGGGSAPAVAEIPRAIADPVEAALATVGGLAGSGVVQAGERGLDLGAATSRARPWMEFIDFSAFGLPEGASEVMSRFKANSQWFFFNYIMVGLGMAAISVITKPLSLLGAVLLTFVYFQLFGSAAEGQEEVAFLGLKLDGKERTGLMVVISAIVIWFAAGRLEILVSILTGTVVISVIHGCLRRPHPDAVAGSSSVV